MGANSDFARYPSAAERERDRLIIRLLRSDQPKSIDLAVALARRGTRSPWGSGACPVLQAQMQAAMVKASDTVLDRRSPLTAVSWFPYESAVPIGGLCGFDLCRFIATRRRALQRTFPRTVAFGVVNMALHVFTNGHTVWVPEVRLLLEATDTTCLREHFLRHCRSDRNFTRAVPFKALNDENRRMYLSCVTEPRFGLQMRKINCAGERTTLVQPLRGKAAVEAALFAHQFPLQCRLILRRLRRVSDRSGFGLKRSA